MTTFYSHVNFAGGASGGADVNPFGRKLFVSNTGVGAFGVRPDFATITGAASAAAAGDTIIVASGTYSESPNFAAANLTVRAARLGSFPDSVMIRGLSTVNADNVTIEGIEFSASAASGAALHVGPTTEANSFVARGCSFSRGNSITPRYGLRIRGGNNHLVEWCRFVVCTNGLALHSGITSLISGAIVRFCEYSENATMDFGNGGTAGDAGVGYAIANLIYANNWHMRGDATPTTMVNIANTVGTSSGAMAGNFFASDTNSSTVIVIPAGILYMANATQAGWSTARPA